jgi:uncharacterized membrane protein YgdD (TMEM256/DUF423 family)
MKKQMIITGSLLAALSVALGALAAHWLKANISAASVQSFDTAVKYQLTHALAMLIMVALAEKFHTRLYKYAYYAFLFGIILFSGSIYLLSTRELTHITWTWLGPLTPLGGLSFITGWILLSIAAYRVNDL